MQIRIPYYLVLWVFIACSSLALSAQVQPPQSDPQAIVLVQQSMLALANGVAVGDVTLTGQAVWIAGSDVETGTITLQAKGLGESRIDLNLSGGSRTEIRNDSAGSPKGETVGPDGNTQPWPQHNCWINASWFFPTLSILAATSDPSVIFAYVGVETRRGRTVQHIRAYRYLSNTKLASVIAGLSTEDIYLDSTSLLPVAFTFNTHPEDDEVTNILLEIDFSNYQVLNGVPLPMRVQKLINGGLALNIAVTGVLVNSGLADAPFAIQ